MFPFVDLSVEAAYDDDGFAVGDVGLDGEPLPPRIDHVLALAVGPVELVAPALCSDEFSQSRHHLGQWASL